MCGIAGSLKWEKSNCNEFKNLKKITSFLSHRGPNFSEVKKIDNVVFGHTRLAIIDLDKSANQPMSDTRCGVKNVLLFLKGCLLLLFGTKNHKNFF